MAVFREQDDGDRIGGVVGVRAAGGGIDHGFGVAVVGGDDPGAAARAERLENPAQAIVYSFYRFDCCFELAGMSYHVRVREIHDDGVEVSFFDRVDHGVGHACRRTFPVLDRR